MDSFQYKGILLFLSFAVNSAWSVFAMQSIGDELVDYRNKRLHVYLDNAEVAARNAIANCDDSPGAIDGLLELSAYVDPNSACKYRAYALDVLGKHADDALYASARDRSELLMRKDAELDAVASLLPCGRGLPEDEYKWRFRASNSLGNLSKAMAEEALVSPIPDTSDELYLEFSQNGNRSHYEKPYFMRENYLDALAVVEHDEGEGRYLTRIEDYLSAICEMKSWTLPAHDGQLESFNGRQAIVDLFASQYAAHLACVLELVGDKLDPKLVQRIGELVERRIFRPLRRDIPFCVTQGADPEHREIHPGYHWWIDNQYNWNAVCWNNVVCAALYFIEDRRERAYFVNAALKSVPRFLSGFSPDGYCHEGMGYWNYGYGYHLMMARLLKEVSNGRIDVVSSPKERIIASYGLGDSFDLKSAPSFADGGGAPSQNVLKLVEYFWPELALTNSLSTAFPDAQVWIFRDPDGLSVGIKGGDNGVAHNHNDLGSYDIRVRGKAASGDPGGEVYTARTFSKRRYESKVLNSYGHPVPIVAGSLQNVGAEHRSEVVSVKIDDQGTSEIVLELKGAYDVSTLLSLRRTFKYDRAGKKFTVKDSVRFSEPTEFEDAYIALPPVNLKPEVKVKGAEFHLKEEAIENPNRPTPVRCGIVLDGPVTEAEVEMVFSIGV